jgi:hypothetical protein
VLDGVDDQFVPPSMLYSILKPLTAVTVGSVNIVLHVLDGAVSTGALGKITTLTSLLSLHKDGSKPGVFAAVIPHAFFKTYLAFTLWQPGVVGIVSEAGTAYVPPSILYCTVNPYTSVTFGSVKDELHVLVGAVITGAVGKITTLTELLVASQPFGLNDANMPAAGSFTCSS